VVLESRMIRMNGNSDVVGVVVLLLLLLYGKWERGDSHMDQQSKRTPELHKEGYHSSCEGSTYLVCS